MSKYKVGQKFQDAHSGRLTYTILAVSPDVDYTGEHSYFIEIQDGEDKWYNVSYDINMGNDKEIIE